MNCKICKSNKIKIIHDTIRECKNNIFECKNCKIVYLEKSKIIDYKRDYNSKLLDSSWGLQKSLKKRSQTLNKSSKEIIDLIKKNNYQKILEIGPGIGANLYEIQKKIKDAKFYFIEDNKEHVNFLKSFSDAKRISDLKTNIKFDLVYAIHLIEHINNPINFIKKIKNIIKPNGTLYLITPNHNDYYFENLKNINLNKYKNFYYHSAHPFYYNKESLNFVLKKSGFQNNSLSTHQDYSILNFFNWYNLGLPSKNIHNATSVPKNFSHINKFFQKYLEENDKGSFLCSCSKKSN